MHRMRVVSLIKQPWILSASQSETTLFHQMTRSPTLVTPYFALPPISVRTMNITRTTSVLTTDEPKTGFLKRIMRKILPDTGKYKRQLTGYMLYEDTANNIKYANYFEDFNMPDTFYSWWVIMELHIWMLMARYMAEGQHGQEIRNKIVEAMWADLDNRKGKLKNANVGALRKQIRELGDQFNAAIIGYDEGIMSDDKVLAAALWRRFFQCECNNPEYLEQLVVYVRKQMSILDSIPSEELLKKRTVEWLDYRNP